MDSASLSSLVKKKKKKKSLDQYKNIFGSWYIQNIHILINVNKTPICKFAK